MPTLSIGAMMHPSFDHIDEMFAQARQLELSHVQIGYSSPIDTPEGVQRLLDASARHSIEITTVFCGFEGESYADIPTIQATVGLVPRQTRAERIEKTRRIADFAHRLGVSRIGAHIGFIPEDEGEREDFDDIVRVVQEICDALAARGQVFALETGQETAAGLKRFLEAVGRENLKVNFDPGNMVMYGKDEPIAALQVLGPWIDGVHCKDGLWPKAPGTLGEEMPLGEGEVDIREWLRQLRTRGYSGPLTIEREISGPKQQADIARGRDLIQEAWQG